jgi:ABC-type branched-subunit amino acid transport system substrate-binding protein
VAIRDALKATDMPETTFGPVKFDARGQNLHPVLVTQIQKGKYVIVNPKSEATGDPIVPTPKWSER